MFKGEAYRPYRLRYNCEYLKSFLRTSLPYYLFFVTIKISHKNTQPRIPTT
ncbi:MAG: hypothetical protein LBH59_03475 [Planctomycetaceae bacterium]|nr:hypothetical protein [Planctomycetaceae bacterium]